MFNSKPVGWIGLFGLAVFRQSAPRLSLALALALTALTACHDAPRSNPLDPDSEVDATVAVTVERIENAATVRWTRYDGPLPFGEYLVLRNSTQIPPAEESRSETEDFVQVTTTAVKVDTLAVIVDPDEIVYQDTTMVPNAEYVYRVSVISSSGIEFASEQSDPVAGPSMQQLAFFSDRTGNWELFIMNADGSLVRNLTNHPGQDGGPPIGGGAFGRPAWSPDGSRIAFVTSRDDDPEIYLMDADGSNLVRLTNNPGLDSFPAWSPDGSRIVFMSERDQGSGIYTMNADGTDVVWIIGDGLAPHWSPDGTRIALWFCCEGGDVFVMNADGTGLVEVFPGPGFAFDPVWSPDGRQIAFAGSGIHIMDADGSNHRVVVESGRWPDWSPDGSQLAYSCSGRGGFDDICVSNADGTNEINLTDHLANDNWAAWRPVVE